MLFYFLPQCSFSGMKKHSRQLLVSFAVLLEDALCDQVHLILN